MVQLIKKGGLRERANRSRTYHGSENAETTLKPNRYQHNTSSVQNADENEEVKPSPSLQNSKYLGEPEAK